MRRAISRILLFPWYAPALGVYTVLELFAQNVNQVDAGAIVRPLAITIFLSCALLLLFRLVLSDWHRSSFLVAVLVLLFFSYGHLYDYVKNADLFGILLGRHRFLLVLWAAMILAALIAATRRKLNFNSMTASLNLVALTLLLFPGVALLSYWIAARGVPASPPLPAQQLEAENTPSLPDVYYIILDSYTRSDVLKKAYGYDNSSFLKDLERLGFYVADCSYSNYMWTPLSISSTLNMGYLQDNPAYTAATNKDIVTEDLIKHSLVRQRLESTGYRTVAFATGFPFNEITDADFYIEPPTSMESSRGFEALLVQISLLRVLQDFGYVQINQTASAEFRDRTLFALDHFDDLARMGGPKFVYIHIIAPHPPFVFGPQGESVDPKDFITTEGQYTDDKYFQGYVDQVEFISREIVRSLQQLLEESPTPPVIILQGDHGPWKQQGENRVSILNAYYLPGHSNALYPGISPVNSFRIVFNQYFHANDPLLDDLSYKSTYARKYDLAPLPTSCSSGK